MNTETVKGFQDFSGEEAKKREAIRKIIVATFEKYGFEPAETPVVEFREFVQGENKNDEAVSDIFKLKDRGERELALRYEFTFQLKRLMQNKKLPFKRYQLGPVFRDEPTQGNRLRQFTQCDVDIVGSSLKDDAEILALTSELMKELKIDAEIYVGNRALLNEVLETIGVTENKEQVLREIDKLGKISEKEMRENLKKLNAEKLLEIIKKPESYFEKFTSYQQIKELRETCKFYGIEINFSPSLVRGLSYYNKNVFEVKTKKIKETITGGGSFMFNGIQCTGISFGLDRLSLIADIQSEKESYLVISLGKDKESIKIAKELREKENSVSIFYGKPSKALEYANSYKINNVIFVGEDEVKSKKFKIKNMSSGKESLLKL